MVKLQEGDIAPLFSVLDSNSKIFNLEDYKNKTIILYFYPKDDTPGCTIEACDFSSLLNNFKEKGVEVFGISADDLNSHKKFISKYHILFPLLIDPDYSVAKLYGVYENNKFIRSTFIIQKLRIKKAFYGVNPLGHAKKVLDSI
ncbi:MAG: peroxiredoxin [Candidatus Anstonellaceae archaeon]